MILIEGKKIAQEIREELKADIKKLKNDGKNIPGLAAILVGDDPASKIYVKSKGKACNEIGMRSITEEIPSDISESELLKIIDSYNKNEDYHGILVHSKK